MDRNESLKFIKLNSRLVNRVDTFSKDEEEADSDKENKNVLEQRLTVNGKPFILHDMGKKGWDIYLIAGSIEIRETIDKFLEYSNMTLEQALPVVGTKIYRKA